MLRKQDPSRINQVEMVSIDSLVPQDHLLRLIDRHVDFTFIYDLVEDLYSQDSGRPSIDPVVLIKLTFLQYLYNIKSMRQTIKDVEVNLAYRWFLGLSFYDPVPHFSTFGKNYKRRFEGTDLFDQIFLGILEQAYEQGLVDPQVQFIDSTHVKAHANRHKRFKLKAQKKTRAYQKKLDQEIATEREEREQKPLDPPKGPPEERSLTKSPNDPEAGLFHKGEHRMDFAYSIQTSCDKNGWILAYQSFPGNEQDSTTFFEFFEKLKPYQPSKLIMDAGYKNPAIAKQCCDENILPIFPYTRPKGRKEIGMFRKQDYLYDEYYDAFICPENQHIHYRRTDREGYRIYQSDPMLCSQCPSRAQCTKSSQHTRVLTRHIWQDYLDEVENYRYTEEGKKLYKKRKETIERSFGTAKEHHGFRFTNMVGRLKMEMKAALTYACMNAKKLALLLHRRERESLNMA